LPRAVCRYGACRWPFGEPLDLSFSMLGRAWLLSGLIY
jgi:hypothetical protein